MVQSKKAFLVLQDGTTFEGVGYGASCLKKGEVVFNTSLTGYQEILTDPSYAGQIITMTYPHMGNTGVNALDHEAKQSAASGFVMREMTEVPSNYRSSKNFSDWLKEQKIPAISGIDTRALVRHIREAGAMPAVIYVGSQKTKAELKKIAKALPGMAGQNLAKVVSCVKSYQFKKGSELFIKTEKSQTKKSQNKKRFKVAAYDFGVKKNILRLLVDAGCDVKVFPYSTPSEKILKEGFDGLFLSNGPGDPSACLEAIENVKACLGQLPIFGICLGHQILSLALGAQTFKLKFGHRGGNQPVKNLKTGSVEITAQNHGFAVDPHIIPNGVEITHVHLNDQTISGISCERLKAFSVQYHPEASPGPHDSRYLFQQFVDLMNQNQSSKKKR